MITNPAENLASGAADADLSTDLPWTDSRAREVPRRMTQTGPVQRRIPRVLILSGDQALTRSLISALDKTGLCAEHKTTLAAGCALVASGQFQVVLTETALVDGSWRRLLDLESRKQPEFAFAIVLVTRTFDPDQCFYAMQDGAFDVIDAVRDLPNVGVVVRRALLAEYLMGAGPSPEAFL